MLKQLHKKKIVDFSILYQELAWSKLIFNTNYHNSNTILKESSFLT